MIQQPKIDQVKLLIPEIIDELDALTEPTVEGIKAEDVIKASVADGGVLPAIWDGRPDFRPKLLSGSTSLIVGDNSTFDSDTGDWTLGADAAIVGGFLRFTELSGGGNGDSTILIADIIGDFEVVFEIKNHTAGGVTPTVGGTAGTLRSGNGTFTETITSGGSGVFLFNGNAIFEADIEFVTIKFKDEFRVDAELNRRPLSPGIDFGMLLNHNLTESYQSAISRMVEWFTAATDSLPATPLEPLRTISGMLGQHEPFLSFEIDSSNRVSVPDSASIRNIFDSGGTAYFRGKISSDGTADQGRIFNKLRWQMWTLNESNGFVDIRFQRGFDGTVGRWDLLGVVPIDVEFTLIIVYNASSVTNDPVFYLNGVLQTTTEDQTPVGDLQTDSGVNLGIGASDVGANPMDGCLSAAYFFNRELSLAEAATLHETGDILPIDKWSDQAQVYLNPWAVDTAGWSVVQTVLLGNVDGVVDDGATLKNDCMTITVDVNTGIHRAEETSVGTVVGRQYVVDVWYLIPSGQDRVDGFEIHGGGGLILDRKSTSATPAVIGTWTHVQLVYTANGTRTDYYLFDGASAAFQDVLGNQKLILQGQFINEAGAVAVYEPNGINETFSKLFDSSSNLSHGTITGADYWNNPNVNNSGFFYQEFSPQRLKFLFANFNPDKLLGETTDTLIGWLLWGRKYDIKVAKNGYSAGLRWPGVNINESNSGVVLTERRFGDRPAWSLSLFPETQLEWDITQEMLDKLQGSLHPFYVVFDYINIGPVLWQVRLDRQVPFKYITGDPDIEGIQLNFVAEGIF